MTDRPDLIENLTEEQRAYAAKVAELNDQLRATIGRPVKNRTVTFMGDLAQELRGLDSPDDIIAQLRLMDLVRKAGPFTEDNDPHGEHDFGSFDFALREGEEAQKVFWKIDLYNLAMDAHSPDATDPEVTHRVLTIFFARDY